MTPQDYAYLSKLLNERSGLHLAGDKQYLIESRLLPVARQNNCGSIGDLVMKLKQFAEEPLRQRVTEAMTINESFFFRDKTPFDHLKDAVLPVLGQARKGSRIRIWCAACSTGQEPYSIAMMLDQNPSLTGGVPVEIVATDISDRCLERARQGLFTQFEVQRGLPIQMLMHYFTQQDDHWRISERMRQMVTFRKLNLIDPNYNMGKFDVVFCRNVLIYFDGQTKVDVLDRIASTVNPGGFLMMGAAESLVGSSQAFEPTQDRRGLYKLVNQASAKAASAA